MVQIDAGEFEMGSNDGRDREKPIHAVTLDAFEISTIPVTQAQYEAVMGGNPSHFKGEGQKGDAGLPVENVSWNDAMVFCEQLTKQVKGKWRYTLPTEEQWEYACRAKTDTRFYTGDKDADLEWAGWYDKNSEDRKHPVGEKEPNDFGLYDMHGNGVWIGLVKIITRCARNKILQKTQQGQKAVRTVCCAVVAGSIASRAVVPLIVFTFTLSPVTSLLASALYSSRSQLVVCPGFTYERGRVV